VRDYSQAKIANDQNEVMKRLAAIASILLFPTFIVGLYGQNFDNMPELHWALRLLGGHGAGSWPRRSLRSLSSAGDAGSDARNRERS